MKHNIYTIIGVVCLFLAIIIGGSDGNLLYSSLITLVLLGICIASMNKAYRIRQELPVTNFKRLYQGKAL